MHDIADQLVDAVGRRIFADIVPEMVREFLNAYSFSPRAGMGTIDPAQLAWRTAERLMRSNRPELVIWGKRVAVAFGVVHARDFQQFLLAIEERCKR